MFDRQDSHEPPDPNTTFNLLSNARRRQLLSEVRRTGTVNLQDVARRIAAAERGVAESDLDPDECKSVYVSLYQSHVPRLEDHGVVEYNADERTVSLVRSPTTRRLLGIAGDENTPPWGRYYAAAALLGVGLLITIWLADGSETAWRVVGGVLGVFTAGIAAAETLEPRRVSRRLLRTLRGAYER